MDGDGHVDNVGIGGDDDDDDGDDVECFTVQAWAWWARPLHNFLACRPLTLRLQFITFRKITFGYISKIRQATLNYIFQTTLHYILSHFKDRSENTSLYLYSFKTFQRSPRQHIVIFQGLFRQNCIKFYSRFNTDVTS